MIGIHYFHALVIIGEKMKAGNLPERVSLEFHYISATLPPFRQESSEKRIIFRPHQSKSLNGYDHNYEPMDVGGEVIELNCPCNTTDGTSNFMTLINERGLKNTLLWRPPVYST